MVLDYQCFQEWQLVERTVSAIVYGKSREYNWDADEMMNMHNDLNNYYSIYVNEIDIQGEQWHYNFL